MADSPGALLESAAAGGVGSRSPAVATLMSELFSDVSDVSDDGDGDGAHAAAPGMCEHPAVPAAPFGPTHTGDALPAGPSAKTGVFRDPCPPPDGCGSPVSFRKCDAVENPALALHSRKFKKGDGESPLCAEAYEEEGFDDAIQKIQERALLTARKTDNKAFASLEHKDGSSESKAKDSEKNSSDSAKATHASTQKFHEVPEDFVRNFLIANDLVRTLDEFQSEWYEKLIFRLSTRQECKNTDFSSADVYELNQRLEVRLVDLSNDLEHTIKELESSRFMYTKVQRERDFYKMHHTRIVQEKARLQSENRRVLNNLLDLEKCLKEKNLRYDTLFKEKSVLQLQLDKVSREKVRSSFNQNTTHLGDDHRKGGMYETPALQHSDNYPKSDLQNKKVSNPDTVAIEAKLAKQKLQSNTAASSKILVKQRRCLAPANLQPDSAEMPSEARENTFASAVAKIRSNNIVQSSQNQAEHLSITSLREVVSVAAHSMPLSSLALHPSKMALATASDDCKWKLWNYPAGDLLMCGEGHTDWISGIDFHPIGTHLATSSGDKTIRIWDFSRASQVTIFAEHTKPVWSCAFHDTGNFIVSGSMDGTAKIWDIQSSRCRQTFRGHSDSVNVAVWQYFSNTFFTGSGDKTIQAWDGRVGRSVKTFYGHKNAVSSLCCSYLNDFLFSADSEGILKIWDIRMSNELKCLNMGPEPVNKISLDMSNTIIAAACQSGLCKLYSLTTGTSHSLIGHKESVQSCKFSTIQADYLVTGSSDGTWKLWN